MDSSAARPHVDFIKELGERSMFHVLDVICQNMTYEMVSSMHEVSRAWNGILVDTGISRRNMETALKRKLLRWREASKTSNNILKRNKHFEVFWGRHPVKEVSHGLMFALETLPLCTSETTDELGFSVLEPNGQTVIREMHFSQKKSKCLRFTTSCDYHRSKLDSNIFISSHSSGLHLLWNLETGASADIFAPDPRRAQSCLWMGVGKVFFAFNCEHLMVLWPVEDIDTTLSTIKLFKLNWTSDGEFAGKDLVDEMPVWLDSPESQLGHNMFGKHMLLMKNGRAKMVTFDQGKLVVLWEHEDSCFDAEMDVFQWTDDRLVAISWSDLGPSFIVLAVDRDRLNKEMLQPPYQPVAGRARPFGKIGIAVLWDSGMSIVLFEEILEHGSLSKSLLESTVIRLCDVREEFLFSGGCRTCFYNNQGRTLVNVHWTFLIRQHFVE